MRKKIIRCLFWLLPAGACAQSFTFTEWENPQLVDLNKEKPFKWELTENGKVIKTRLLKPN